MTERRRVLFYGDSNTYGYDPRGFLGGRYPSELIWVSRVREALKDSWTVMTDGMNGREIPSSPLTMQALDRTLKRCAPLDLFAVMLGSNDLLFSDPDPQKAADKMERMLEHVTVVLERENQKVQAEILLIAPPLDYSDGERLKKASVRLGVLYRELAERKHYHFLDVGSQNFSLAFDGLHFSEEGHRQMGEFAAGALAKL